MKKQKQRDWNVPSDARAKKGKLMMRLTMVKNLTPANRVKECTEVFKVLRGNYKSRIEFIAQYSGYTVAAAYKWGADYGWRDIMSGVISEKEGEIVTALTKVAMPNPDTITVGTVMNLMKLYISLATSINIDVVGFGYQMISWNIAKLNDMLKKVDYRPDYFTLSEQRKFDELERQLWMRVEKIAFLIDPSKIARFANALGIQNAPKSFSDVDQTAFTPKYLQERIIQLGLKKNKNDFAKMIQDVAGEDMVLPNIDGRLGQQSVHK